MIKGVLWDNDGVLVDTEALYFQASAETLATIGIRLTREEFAEISMKQGGSVFSLTGPHIASHRIEALRRERDERYSCLLRQGAPVIEGVRETLEQLHGRVRMAIVTSSRREHFELIHRKSGLLPYFDFVLAREDYVQAKPHPEPYLRALERWGLDARECLAIEDSPRGLASAHAAGLRCLVVPGDFFPPEQFAKADRLLKSVREVAPFFLTASRPSPQPRSAPPLA